MKESHNFLSAEERQRVNEAVTKAEKMTSGEIVVLIVGQSKRSWHLHMNSSQAVHRRAELEFMKLGIQQTKDRTGVLIMISLKERMVVVKADRDINQRVSNVIWREVVRLIVESIKNGQACNGLCQGVGRIGGILAMHFPPKSDHVNQLPNDVIEKG